MDDLVELTQFSQTNISLDKTTHRTYLGQNQWQLETWVKSEELGRGTYGAVWLEKEERSRRVRAVKQVRKNNAAWDYRKEIAAMAKVRQFPQYFAYFHGWYESEDRIFLAMDFFALGNLSRHLNPIIPEEQAKDITRQLLHGLREMHRMGFTHRDLKPQNIFVVAKWPSAWDVRIGDFGIAKRVQENETALRTLTGTRAYMAPEMYPYLVDDEESHAYTQAVDIWALGILVFQMLTSQIPFSEENPLHKFFKGRSGFPEAPLQKEAITPSGMDFIKALLQPSWP